MSPVASFTVQNAMSEVHFEFSALFTRNNIFDYSYSRLHNLLNNMAIVRCVLNGARPWLAIAITVPRYHLLCFAREL